MGAPNLLCSGGHGSASRGAAIGEKRLATPGEVQTLGAGIEDSTGEIREASVWALGLLGRQAAPLVPAITVALGDRDPVVRGLAALALRDAGPEAVTALDTLVGRLKDEDVNVRMMSAQAIGRQGSQAVRAAWPTHWEPSVRQRAPACRRFANWRAFRAFAGPRTPQSS